MSQNKVKVQGHLTVPEKKKLDKKASHELMSTSTLVRKTLVETLKLSS